MSRILAMLAAGTRAAGRCMGWPVGKQARGETTAAWLVQKILGGVAFVAPSDTTTTTPDTIEQSLVADNVVFEAKDWRVD
jgi:hypothetical protein